MTSEEQTTIDTLMELKQLLQTENEYLNQQYNHLMIRNHKLMKRIDDQQMLNDKLQERIAGLEQLINTLRQRNDGMPISVKAQNQIDSSIRDNDNLNSQVVPSVLGLKSNSDVKQLVSRWSSLAGDSVKNTPTKTRQMQILTLLYERQKMSGMKLFIACGITGVSGARYISALKQFGLIEFSGFRKDGFYFITEKGKKLVEDRSDSL
jgi:predicted transcriptional regulator